jgi:putative oxidoreductase
VQESEAFNLAMLLFRGAVGAIMLAHGINHVFRGGKIAGTAGWFESLGMRPGILHAWLASITEIVAGAMLLVGLLTPVAAAGVVGVMLVAWITNHLKNGFFIFRPGEGWEYVMLLTVCGLVLGTIGAGAWSLDDALDLFQPFPGRDGLLIAGGLGGGGAALLLAIFWRPKPKEAAA